MSNFTVSQDVFDYFKERYDEWANCDFLGMDDELKNIVPALAAIDGVVPIFSCASHPGQGTSRETTYFVLACTEVGLPRLTSLYKEITKQFREACEMAGMTLHFTASMSVRERPFYCNNSSFYYWAHCIKFEGIEEHEKKQLVLTVLEKVLTTDRKE